MWITWQETESLAGQECTTAKEQGTSGHKSPGDHGDGGTGDSPPTAQGLRVACLPGAVSGHFGTFHL